MQIVILAGGKGTRLLERLGEGMPKPMVDVGGRPLVEHHIRLAAAHGFRDIVLLTGYGADYIREFCGDGSQWGIDITCVEEPGPLGTAGAVLACLDQLSSAFLVSYGDTMLNVDLTRFWRTHMQSGADATLFLHPNDHPFDSDLVEVDDSDRILAFHPYPHPPGSHLRNLVNAALYAVNRDALRPWQGRTDLPDFAKHLFPAMVANGAKLLGYRSPEYIKDAGTPKRLDRVTADYQSGRIGRGSLQTKAPVVFLDRDGTLNREVDRVSSADTLVVLDGVAEAIARLNRSEYRTVVITNQPVIARGDCDEAELRRIHNKLESMLGEHHAYLDAIYYCPHHPDSGFPGERRELKIRCDCRKPGIALVQQAAAELNLDLSRGWLIGDTTVDVQTAKNAGIRSILVATGHGGRDSRFNAEPDYRVATLNDAVDIVLSHSDR